MLQKLVSVQEITTRDDIEIGEGKKEIDKKNGEGNFKSTNVDYIEQIATFGDDDVDEEIGKEGENDRVSVDKKQGEDEEVEKEGEKKKNGVDEEEMGKNIEYEQQREFIAEDIVEMEEEVVFDTSPLFSTADVEKMFGGATDVNIAVEITTSYLMGQSEQGVGYNVDQDINQVQENATPISML
ncbi:hypothetical protein PanWU01x14_335470 [Parasponia andersonii]|uniref:Uncharacterized protein n=1 Tax=Parasponia andersonii TaxID=3476 RepID=A0A2P5AG91_PARAD|nr:hypothetical protein PanWU01x14_335470 [Parasponia andersonii]